jgi:DNA-binding CsgD family transcriptional regulator
VGRPKKDISDATVAELAYDGASNRDIAAILGCDEATVRHRFSAILGKQRAERRMAIRKAQREAALGGNPAMLIWLGKQELGQVDKSERKNVTSSRSNKVREFLADTPPETGQGRKAGG